MKLKPDYTVSGKEYDESVELNRRLLKENTELRIQISHLQYEIAKLKEANLHVN